MISFESTESNAGENEPWRGPDLALIHWRQGRHFVLKSGGDTFFRLKKKKKKNIRWPAAMWGVAETKLAISNSGGDMSPASPA